MRLLLPLIGSGQVLLLEALGGVGHGSADRDGAESAERISALVAGLPLPQRLRDVGIDEVELADIARLTMSDNMMANLPRSISEDEVLALLRSAWRARNDSARAPGRMDCRVDA